MDDLTALLAPWMTAQRWFAGKLRASRLEVVGSFVIGGGPLAPAGVVCRVHLVRDRSDPGALYQVPLTERDQPLKNAEHVLLGVVDGLWIYDGPHDPAFAAALLRLMLDEGAARSDVGVPPNQSGFDQAGRIAAFGHSDTDEVLHVVSSRVLSGEQSNTSIILETSAADGTPATPVICKIFRTLHHGENPDVVLTGALGAAGSRVVPRSIGHLTGRWPDIGGEPDGMATGHLAFAQEFLPGVEDAWRVALVAAAADEDFGDMARQLGEATAEMHAALASALPSRATTPADIASVVAGMRARFETAVLEVPQLERHRERLTEVYTTAQATHWPPLQRVHGDFHLGQVIAVPDRGWVVLDFEGEPLRAMKDRSAPDSPLRDVAGMLRSFDYVAGSIALSNPGRGAKAWASAARQAFLAGYDDGSGLQLLEHRALLDAFEVDKALYEAVYEVRNRPDWLSIPVDAIDRLLSS
ncbi:MAG: phosphotransferase [Microbacteriaceae bacterium]|nr:phosphotransferase [Microbacteriaceae bacterium]